MKYHTRNVQLLIVVLVFALMSTMSMAASVTTPPTPRHYKIIKLTTPSIPVIAEIKQKAYQTFAIYDDRTKKPIAAFATYKAAEAYLKYLIDPSVYQIKQLKIGATANRRKLTP